MGAIAWSATVSTSQVSRRGEVLWQCCESRRSTANGSLSVSVHSRPGTVEAGEGVGFGCKGLELRLGQPRPERPVRGQALELPPGYAAAVVAGSPDDVAAQCAVALAAGYSLTVLAHFRRL